MARAAWTRQGWGRSQHRLRHRPDVHKAVGPGKWPWLRARAPCALAHCLNVAGAFSDLCSALGCSRYLVHCELTEATTEADVETSFSALSKPTPTPGRASSQRVAPRIATAWQCFRRAWVINEAWRDQSSAHRTCAGSCPKNFSKFVLDIQIRFGMGPRR